MKKRYSLVFLIIASLFILYNQADAAGLCKGKIGDYYVNIAILNDTFGAGLDDVFDVSIKRVLPKTEAEVDKLKGFNYYDGKDEDGAPYEDGRKYFWKEEHNAFRLYKEVAGRKPVRVELFAAVFPPEKKAIYHMKLLQSNPKIYRENKLDSSLDYLGIMGVTYRGREATVDFINNKRFVNSDLQSQVVVSNADTMLYRYGLYKGLGGTTSIVTGNEIQGGKGFETLLKRAGEQAVLDNWKFLLEAAYVTDDTSTILTTIGGKDHKSTISGGISEIQLIYVPCIPEGNNTYGAPRAAFVPIQDAGSTNYPLFVFPTAFSSFEALQTEIKRELYHAQWWSAAANMSDPNSKFLKEALLRYTIPYLEADIFGRMKETKLGTEMYFSHRSLFHSAAKSAMSQPERTDQILPWTVSNALINPMPMRTGDNYYNKVVFTVTDINSFGGKSDKKLNGKEKEKKRKIHDLLEAMLEGYVRSAEDRNKLFRAALETASYGELAMGLKQYMDSDSGWVGDKGKVSLELIEKLKKDPFQYSDLGWLNWCVGSENGPLNDLKEELFGKRLRYLSEKITAINGLDNAAGTLVAIDKIQDQEMKEQVLSFVASSIKKAKKVLGALGKEEKVLKEIEDLTAQLENFKKDFDVAEGEFDAASKDYSDKLEKFTTILDEKYKAMQSKCSSPTTPFKPDRDWKIGRMINFAPVKSEECLEAIRAYSSYRVGDDRRALREAKEEKEKKSDGLRVTISKGKKLVSRLDALTQKGEILDEKIQEGIEIIDETLEQRSYTWKKWLKEALVEYFTKAPDKTPDNAYEDFKKKVEIVPYVELIERKGESR